jgi:nucleoside phosphorylase
MKIKNLFGSLFFENLADEKYSILVASALREELTPFLKGENWTNAKHDKNIRIFNKTNSRRRNFNVVSYSINKMGMPINGVGLTKVIERYEPKYVIFIGTCAGLNPKSSSNKSGNSEGDVLIPDYIYAYDSGKHNDKGEFKIEHRHYDVSQNLRGIAIDMLEEIRKTRFEVDTDCGFCSGASVVSNKDMRDAIVNDANRKVAGFDMEAYVLACINNEYPNVETIVIKGIMDFGKKKSDSNKKKAKENCAKIAKELVSYIIENDSTLL